MKTNFDYFLGIKSIMDKCGVKCLVVPDEDEELMFEDSNLYISCVSVDNDDLLFELDDNGILLYEIKNYKELSNEFMKSLFVFLRDEFREDVFN